CYGSCGRSQALRHLTDCWWGCPSGMSSKIAADRNQGRVVEQPGRSHQQTFASDRERERTDPGAATARLRRENASLEAQLEATAADLAASRIRLVEAADAERRRIERDLHDSVQQQLVGIRIKLELAAERIKPQTAEGGRMIDSIGRQMDEVLETLRSLARGI